jgi:hypothetical protein
MESYKESRKLEYQIYWETSKFCHESPKHILFSIKTRLQFSSFLLQTFVPLSKAFQQWAFFGINLVQIHALILIENIESDLVEEPIDFVENPIIQRGCCFVFVMFNSTSHSKLINLCRMIEERHWRNSEKAWKLKALIEVLAIDLSPSIVCFSKKTLDFQEDRWKRK